MRGSRWQARGDPPYVHADGERDRDLQAPVVLIALSVLAGR
ncbi:hypothetical protein [Streptomyces brasiliensis]|nr:hypothetical protein [Streptomyces brasiliensis]